MDTLGSLIENLPSTHRSHNTSNPAYLLLKQLAFIDVKQRFQSAEPTKRPFGPFGDIVFPYFEMGNINSLDLFGLDELIIFSFYWTNKERYKKVLDIGANIGLHSLILDRCGFSVTAYEPDPVHYEKLVENLSLNGCTHVTPVKAAVSTEKGTTSFVRVLGNTTSSHIAGAKDPYGDLETFEVEMHDIHELIAEADLIKLDIEGHEKDLLLSLDAAAWNGTDMMLEVGSAKNADAIYAHLQSIGINAFSQKKGWRKIETRDDVPESHRDGSLFISTKDVMPWDAECLTSIS